MGRIYVRCQYLGILALLAFPLARRDVLTEPYKNDHQIKMTTRTNS